MSDSDAVMHAAKIKRMSGAIMEAIGTTGDQEDIIVVMASIGVVAGCMAAASSNPDASMNVLARAAAGIVSGDLLD